MNTKQLKKRNRLLILFVLIGLICFIMIEWLIDELRHNDADWVPVNKELQEWLDWGKEFAPAGPQVININEASEAEFTTLTGIGPAKAKEIITYREENGPFTNIEQIMNVTGIGPATYENIKEWITVGEEGITAESANNDKVEQAVNDMDIEAAENMGE